jgi:hypothetical protein
MFAKNNLLKINYTKTQERSVSLTGTYGSSYHQSIGNVTESFSGVLKYSIKGDTLLLPATTVSIYNKIPPSKYKIKLQGDSLVHLQLILNNKELALRRDNIRRTLNIYYDYFPKEYPFETILDAVTNFRCNHTFLILKYD